MSSPVRRALGLLRQHFLLLSGPLLGVCAGGYIVLAMVQRILLRVYPLVDPRSLRGAGYVTTHQAISNGMRANFIRAGIGECTQTIEVGFEVIALAVTILLVSHIAKYGDDAASAALYRLTKIPAVTGNLLRFFVIVLMAALGMTLFGALPVAILIPLRASMHMAPSPPRWIFMLTAYVVKLLFALCVMPFFLNLVWRLLRPSAFAEEAPEGLLRKALGYAGVAVSFEFALWQMIRPLQGRLELSPPLAELLRHSVVGLASSLIAAVPTIVCVVTITLMVMDAAQPVAEVKLA